MPSASGGTMFRLFRNRRAILATAALVLLCSAAALAQARWMKAAPFPEPDEELYGVAANGRMYVMGGFQHVTAKTPDGLVFEYNPGADTWTKKKTMARSAHHTALVEYRGKIYVFGGFVPP